MPVGKYKTINEAIKSHSQKVRELEKRNPDRDWKFNLSKEQIDEIEKKK